ncbi:MAG: amidohydrolase [Lentihominibacter sp.]
MSNTIFINGHIYTMNQEMPFAEAVVISGSKIQYTGDNESALSYRTGDSVITDLEGRMMLPGFIDAHCHPLLAAFWLSGLVLNVDMNKEEVLDSVREFIESNPDKDNYFGIGYPEWEYDEKGPNKRFLDEICSDKPVFILGSSGHEGWCNSKTLEVLDITRDTPDPLPGFQYFERDENGDPTGHIVECGATKILMDGIDWFDPDVVRSSFEEIFTEYSEMGVTSLIDCGIFESLEETSMKYIEGYEKNGQLKQRICSCVMVEDRGRLPDAVSLLEERSRKYCSDDYYINTLKIVNDGTIESRSASLFEPYDEDGSNVDPMVSGKELYDICTETASKGYDIHIHAIGDRGIYETLMAAKAVREAGYHETRITNAHTDFVRPQDNRLFGKYNVIANTTGVWHYGNPDINKLIGDRADEQFRMLSIIKEGARMSLGSDKPVDEYGPEPLKSIQVAVTRQLYNDPDAPILEPQSEKLSIQQCLEGFTVNAAYQMHMEDKLGTIEAGKYADLVILGKDIFEIPVQEIYNTPVIMTIKNGEITYKA